MRQAGKLAIVTIALVLVPLSGLAAGDLPPGGTFVDDDGNTHEGFIEAIAAEGITKGCNPPTNDRYCPSDPVTRGEMAAFLVRALGYADPGAGDRFVDDDNSIFEGDIDRLAEAGVTKGCNPPTNDRYCPSDPVTRGEMAAFLVRASGYADPGAEDRFVDDDNSIFEEDIDRLAEAGVTKGCNPPTNDRYCPDQPVRRDEMASFLGRALGLTPMVPPPRPTVELTEVAGNYTIPVHLAAPAGDDRLFIVEKRGTVQLVDGGSQVSRPFLDISSEVINSGEMGLLSIAFHPAYADNGRFFVYYSGSLRSGGSGDHTSYVSEFTVSSDPDVASSSETVILTVDQPYSNHNGGQLAFGPDGYLYIGLGDGGSGGDPGENGQNPHTLLGSLLRIDVDGPGTYQIPADNPFADGADGAPEVWAYGLRNPWRFSFDGDQLYIGDVGQGAWEEVDAVAADTGGLNFGWDRLEGTHCYEPATGCSSAGTVLPVLEYGHAEGCSVTGGHVYRGSELPHLDGRYFYADYCQGWIKSFRLVDGAATDRQTEDLGDIGSVYSFGVDGQGELYVLTTTGVHRFTAS